LGADERSELLAARAAGWASRSDNGAAYPIEGALLNRAKLTLFLTLYAAQGLPFGFFTQALPVLMRQQDYALRWIGLANLLALPWALKWVWAPVVDRYYVRRWGRRRSWILPLQLASCGVLIAITAFGDAHAVAWLVVGSLITNLLAATQDIATDGLAVEQLGPAERGLGNGIQVAGYRLGMIAGGSGILLMLDAVGWTAATATLAGLLFLLGIPAWNYQETPVAARPRAGFPLVSFLRGPQIRRWLLVLVTYKFGDAIATAMFKPMMVDAGMSLTDIGWIGGALGSVSGLIGALCGGLWLNRLGPSRALLGFGLLSALCLLCYALVGDRVGFQGFALLTIVEHFSGGMATVALFSSMMSHCRPGHEGSDYTVQASLVVLTTGAGSALSGFGAETLGYGGLFWIASLLAAAGAVFASRVSRTVASQSPAPSQ
jgi:MFS transporter, PAT family, beta-lactamase induction signal transducer AmpG